MTAIKICGMTRVEDALHAAACGADLLGMIFVPASPRHVSVDRAAEIAQAVRAAYPSGIPLLVGVLVNAAANHVRQVFAQCGLDLVQLHGDESPAYAASLGLPYILARRVGRPGALEDLDRYEPWAYLLDSYDPARAGGSGAAWTWTRMEDSLPTGARLILAGGLMPENVQEGLQAVRPWGVDVASGVEERPGIKDPERVAAFIAQVKEYDRHDHEH